MPRHLHLTLLCFLAAGLVGCVSSGTGPGGGATLAALDGGLIGRVETASLPGSAQRAALEAEYQALQFGRVGMPVTWEDDGFRGEVVPTQLYRVGSQDCRGYTHTVSRGQARIREVGTACRTGDLWTPVA